MQLSKLKQNNILFPLLLLLLTGALLFSLFTGSHSISMNTFFKELCSGNQTGVAYRIFIHVRFPRTLAAALAGAALATSGVLIQAVLNNALAGPNIIGVNSGAGFFALLCASLFPTALFLIPIAAFAGALCTSMLIYALASKTGASRITIVLAGVAMSGILSAGIDTLTILFPDDVIGATGFMVGSFSGVTLSALHPAGWMIMIGILSAVLLSYDLNVLSLGEETAAGLGMNVKMIRFIAIVIASLLAGAAVSFAGLLGFVGLITPHISRKFVGNNNRLLIPCSAILGAIFTLVCDTLGRVLFAPFEFPVGILLSFLGGPFFLFLLLQRGKGRIYD